MDLLYDNALRTHVFSELILILTITLFYLFTQYNKDFIPYKKRIRILMPIYAMSFAFTVFTGIILLVVYNTTPTLAVMLMIVLSIALLTLEILRHKRLLRTPSSDAKQYERFAKAVYAVELIAIFGVSFLAKSAVS